MCPVIALFRPLFSPCCSSCFSDAPTHRENSLRQGITGNFGGGAEARSNLPQLTQHPDLSGHAHPSTLRETRSAQSKVQTVIVNEEGTFVNHIGLKYFTSDRGRLACIIPEAPLVAAVEVFFFR
jgi:hypothetical protein